MNDANDEAKADYRVTLRNMLSSLKARIPIRPSSPDLTFGIMVIVLSLMMSIVRGVDANALDPSSTVCETLRQHAAHTPSSPTAPCHSLRATLVRPARTGVVQPRAPGEAPCAATTNHDPPLSRGRVPARRPSARRSTHTPGTARIVRAAAA